MKWDGETAPLTKCLSCKPWGPEFRFPSIHIKLGTAIHNPALGDIERQISARQTTSELEAPWENLSPLRGRGERYPTSAFAFSGAGTYMPGCTHLWEHIHTSYAHTKNKGWTSKRSRDILIYSDRLENLKETVEWLEKVKYQASYFKKSSWTKPIL